MKLANENLSYVQNIENNLNNKWIDLLCKYGDRNEFELIRQNNNSTPLAIMKYRRILRDLGYGNVYRDKLEEAYNNKQYDKLHNALEYMFLEPIPENNFKYIISKLNQKENSIKDLFNKHTQNKNRRILTIVLIL